MTTTHQHPLSPACTLSVCQCAPAAHLHAADLTASARLDPGPYDHMDEDDFAGDYCACGRRMHASDTECERCWRAREYPEA